MLFKIMQKAIRNLLHANIDVHSRILITERKRRKLARLMFYLIDIRNVCLGNALDVDLNIT